jgi:hypothetical protein
MQPANILQGAYIRLTALNPADIPLLTPWYQDAGFMRQFAATPAGPKSEEALKQ